MRNNARALEQLLWEKCKKLRSKETKELAYDLIARMEQAVESGTLNSSNKDIWLRYFEVINRIRVLERDLFYEIRHSVTTIHSEDYYCTLSEDEIQNIRTREAISDLMKELH